MKNFLSKIYSFFGTLGLSLMVASFCYATSGFSDSADKKPIINVAIYAPFSNESAFIGRNMLGAMETARDQLKSSQINYEFYTLDKMPNGANATNTLQKFIDTHHINVILTEGADSGAQVAPLAKKNKLIHFCLSDDSTIADGKNNFLAQSPNHQKAAALTDTMKPEFIAQFKQEHFSQPVTEAGYAFDIFQLLHNSAVLAMKSDSDFSSQTIATHLLALDSGFGVMGAFNLDKNGLSYKKATTLTA